MERAIPGKAEGPEIEVKALRPTYKTSTVIKIVLRTEEFTASNKARNSSTVGAVQEGEEICS